MKFYLPEYLHFLKGKNLTDTQDIIPEAQEKRLTGAKCDVKLPVPSIKEQQSIVSINKILQK